jgi:hypothetical protein
VSNRLHCPAHVRWESGWTHRFTLRRTARPLAGCDPRRPRLKWPRACFFRNGCGPFRREARIDRARTERNPGFKKKDDTTISPYLCFWQASEEVEEEKAAGQGGLILLHALWKLKLTHYPDIGWKRRLSLAAS